MCSDNRWIAGLQESKDAIEKGDLVHACAVLTGLVQEFPEEVVLR